MKRRRRWFRIYKVVYGKPQAGPVEPVWLVEILGHRWTVRHCMRSDGGW